MPTENMPANLYDQTAKNGDFAPFFAAEACTAYILI